MDSLISRYLERKKKKEKKERNTEYPGHNP
jgi:hypothetical protein